MAVLMKFIGALAVLSLLMLSSCGSSHPLAGNWSEVMPDGKPGMTLTFDGSSSKMAVHGRPQQDGSHSHPKATYTFDGQAKTVTVTGRIVDGVKDETWTGKVDGDVMELAGADIKLEFRRGGQPHGH